MTKIQSLSTFIKSTFVITWKWKNDWASSFTRKLIIKLNDKIKIQSTFYECSASKSKSNELNFCSWSSLCIKIMCNLLLNAAFFTACTTIIQKYVTKTRNQSKKAFSLLRSVWKNWLNTNKSWLNDNKKSLMIKLNTTIKSILR